VNRIVHQTPIPLEGWEEAYEYPLPLSNVPREAAEAWRGWLAPLVGLDVEGVQRVLRRRYESSGTRFTELRDRVLEYVPFSILVYGGTPLLWMRRAWIAEHDFIYLPPQTAFEELLEELGPYRLESPEPVADLLANFGGLGQRWPWEEIEFAGQKEKGRTVIMAADDSFLAGLEYCSDEKRERRLANLARWRGGVTILDGGDGLWWHLGRDGSICSYEGGLDHPYDDVFDSLEELIAAFLAGDPQRPLFDRIYVGLRSDR
jgi:hypothetical protein